MIFHTRFFSREEMVALADRINARARSERVVHLTPHSAELVARALRAYAAHPTAYDLQKIICGRNNCTIQSCYTCRAKANSIMGLFQNAPAGTLE